MYLRVYHTWFWIRRYTENRLTKYLVCLYSVYLLFKTIYDRLVNTIFKVDVSDKFSTAVTVCKYTRENKEKPSVLWWETLCFWLYCSTVKTIRTHMKTYKANGRKYNVSNQRFLPIYKPVLHRLYSTTQGSGVPRGEGGWGVQTPPPHPEIPKFWQSWAKFPVPWKIHPWQPNRNTGFTHLQIEQNPWLEGYRPQIPVLSALCIQLNLLNAPPPPKFLV
jgi:hypothetical protein